MKIDVNQVIKEEIQRLNELFEKGSKISKTEFKPFSIEDYTYLEESKSYFGSFELPTFLAYGIFKDVEHRINNPTWFKAGGTYGINSIENASR